MHWFSSRTFNVARAFNYFVKLFVPVETEDISILEITCRSGKKIFYDTVDDNNRA